MNHPYQRQDEHERLVEVIKNSILDTPSEIAFDEITKLSATICDAPISIISIADKNQLWFKSSFGLETSEIPKENKFCNKVMISHEILIIENTELPESSPDSQLCINEKVVKFYAGVPLISGSGSVLGTICVLDFEKKTLNEKQILTLSSLAKQVMLLFDIKLRDEKFKILKEQYEAIQNMSQTGGWELDVATLKTLWSEGVYRIHNIPVGTPTNKLDGISYYAPHERSRISNLIEDLIKHGRSFDEEFEFYDATGVHKWVRSIAEPKFDKTGKVIKIVGTFQDVSMVVESRLELQKLNEVLVDAQNISKIGSWSFNLTTKQQTWSPEHYKIFEIDFPQTQEALHTLYRSRIHPADLPELDRVIERAMNEGLGFIYDHRVVLENGQRIKYVQGIGKVTKDEAGKPIYLSGTCRDRTLDVEQDKKFQTILETIGEGVIAFEASGAIVQFNQAALKILELTKDEMQQKSSKDPLWKFIKENGDEYRMDEYPLSITLRTGKPVRNAVVKYKSSNENYKWLSVNSFPVLEESVVKLAIITFSDITELVASKEENRFILDTVGIGVWKFNPNTLDLVWDQSMYDLFGTSPEKFSGHYQAWESSLEPDARAQAIKALDLALKGEKEFNHTFAINYKNIEKRHIGGRAQVIRNKDGTPSMMYGVNWDRTKEVELDRNLDEERKRSNHNAKLAAIGQLAAGVGHEINNPLAIISGQIFIVEQTLKASESVQVEVNERLKNMKIAITRISNIVKTLRNFARSDDGIKTEFAPYDLAKEAVNMLKDLYLKEEVNVTLTGDKNTCLISGDKGRIQQVLVNLISNAKDATIGLANRKIEVAISYEKEHVKFAIKDNGCGIPDELKQKIFTPFFTTKEINKGTGIGLSLVSNIVQEHGGRIELDSSVGSGSTFTVLLPVTSGQTEILEKKQSALKTKEQERIQCNVLIVDDEQDLREIFQFIVSKICSHVVVAESAQEGYEIISKGKIDIVFSDIKMPKLNGFDFFRMISENKNITQPKFVFLTGGVELTKEELNIIQTKTNGLLTKPLVMEDVLKTIKELFPERVPIK